MKIKKKILLTVTDFLYLFLSYPLRFYHNRVLMRISQFFVHFFAEKTLYEKIIGQAKYFFLLFFLG